VLSEQAERALEALRRGASSQAARLLEVLVQANPAFSTLENEQGYSKLENEEYFQLNSCNPEGNAPPDERKRRLEEGRG